MDRVDHGAPGRGSGPDPRSSSPTAAPARSWPWPTRPLEEWFAHNAYGSDSAEHAADAAYSQYAARQVRDLIERYEPCVVWNDNNWPDAGQHDGTLDDLRAFYTGAIFAGLTLATVPLILLYLVLAEAVRAEGLRFARRRVTWSDTERVLTMHPDEGISRGFAQAIRGTAVDGGTIHLRQAGD